MICAAGGVWRRTDATAATSSSQRRCVYAQMTTEIDGPGDVGGWPVANLSALPLGPAWSWQRPASQRPVVGAAAEDVGDQRPPVVQRLLVDRVDDRPWPSRHPLADEGAQHQLPVVEGAEVGPATTAAQLDARHLGDAEVRLHGVHHELGLDLEAVRGEREGGQALPTERAEPVAEVAEADEEQRVRQTRQGLVPDAAEECEVQGSPVGQEPGPLDEVVAVEERRDELVDLGGVHAAVGVDPHDDVPARGREAGPQGSALAPAVLGDHDDVTADGAGDGDGAVHGVPGDEDDLVDERGEPLEDPGDVRLLVEGG